jgi:hypothetical protein
VSTVTNFCVPLNARNFWSGWATVGFSRTQNFVVHCNNCGVYARWTGGNWKGLVTSLNVMALFVWRNNKTTKILNQNGKCAHWDSNHMSPEYETVLLPLELTSSAKLWVTTDSSERGNT